MKNLEPKQWVGVGLLGLVVGAAILVAKAPTPPELMPKPEPKPEPEKRPNWLGDLDEDVVDAEFQVLSANGR